MKIGIIGGGWTGLVLARKLIHSTHQVTIFEKEHQLGGLATYHDYGDFFWDRFYHVILPTDKSLLGFIDEIGLTDKLQWKHTLTGFYVEEKFYSVSTTKEFLLFPPLNLFQKFRLGLTIVAGARIENWRKLENISVEDWLIKYSGKTTYEKFWKPLLLAKLGDSYHRISAVFIWSYIKRLFAARGDSSAKKEQMGYVSGGYKTLIEQLEQQLSQGRTTIRNNTAVEHIAPNPNGGILVHANGQKQPFDKVVFTGPTGLLEQLADTALHDITGNIRAVEYLGVVCMILVLRKPLTPFYVLNIADDRIPFTGVIGMSTLVDTRETGDHHLVYLPKYVVSDDPFLKKEEKEIKALFFEGLKRMYPDFSMEHVVSVHINRAIKVQPMQTLNYSKIIPKVKTKHPDFFVLNTAQFVNNTLNNNSVTTQVEAFLQQFGINLEQGQYCEQKNYTR